MHIYFYDHCSFNFCYQILETKNKNSYLTWILEIFKFLVLETKIGRWECKQMHPKFHELYHKRDFGDEMLHGTQWLAFSVSFLAGS